MKLALLLKHRNGRRGLPRVSFFPFLAVLICTMGALVLLLLTVTRQARLQALREAAAKASQQQAEARAGREQSQARIEDLHNSRQATEAELAKVRAQLEGLETEAARLRARMLQSDAAWKGLGATEAEARRKTTESQAELRRLETQISNAQRRLSAARQSAERRGPSYAVVPYQGPNETHRRPIYLECGEEAIVLQPEGIAFSTGDFDGPLGSDSPLAAALRVARDRHRPGAGAPSDEVPYPLLLVRPSGIAAYYAAREAIKAYGTEFGYELIGQDWKLQFPPSDPESARAVREAVAAARLRQQQRIAALPRPSGRRAGPVYRAGVKGGLTQVGGAPDEEPTGGSPAEGPGRTFGSLLGLPGADRSQGGGLGGGPSGGLSGGLSGGPGGGLGSGAGELGLRSDAGAPSAGGSNRGSPDGLGGPSYAGSAPTSSSGLRSAESSGGGLSPYPRGESPSVAGPLSSTVPDGPGGPASARRHEEAAIPSRGAAGLPRDPIAMAGPEGPPARRSAAPPEGYIPGQPTEGPSSPEPQSVAGGQPSLPLRPGEWQPTERSPPPPEEPPEDLDDHKKDRSARAKRLADERGHDWALRDAARSASPVARSVAVACYADRLVILPDQGKTGEAIPFDGATSKSIDKFVSALWKHMGAWGIAGKGMYWRPILRVYVAPGAEARFDELRTLLEGSGLTVERRP